ncbi:MAG: GAF domain-containing sensor histidine kinase [Chloroflexota bacterium]|nr:GAF domain-containing sensor histidine kinase [Chloroflexota bacterium]
MIRAADPLTWEERARRAEERLAALDEAIRGISGVLTLDRVLQLIVDRVRDLADAEYAALGIVDADGVIERFLTSGMSQAARDRIGAFPRGLGLLGLIIRDGQTLRLPDIGTDPRRSGFPPNHPPMHSFLGVPVKVKGNAVGDLYLTNKRGATEFSEDDELLVERFALHAGLAIENARLSQQVQALAVVEERERIGRDLHDGIIQRIYAVALGLDDLPQTIVTDPAGAAERVDRAIDALHAAISEIRTFIYGLRPGLQEAGDIVSTLETLAEELRLQSSLEIVVDADVPIDLPSDIAAEVSNVAREALSNAARHAAANLARVVIEETADGPRLVVADDGRGFDPATPLDATHNGLANMRARAARIGGRLEIESGPGRGTRIILSLPPSK